MAQGMNEESYSGATEGRSLGLGGKLEDAHGQLDKLTAVIDELAEKLSPVTRRAEIDMKSAGIDSDRIGVGPRDEADVDYRAPLEKRVDELTLKIRNLQRKITTTTEQVTV